MSIVLTPAERTEAMANLAAVRRLGLEMADVFSAGSPEALEGAQRMVGAIDRVEDLVRRGATPAEHAEAIGDLIAVRQLAAEMVDVLSHDSREAREGAERMVAAVDRVLELLGAQPRKDAR